MFRCHIHVQPAIGSSINSINTLKSQSSVHSSDLIDQNNFEHTKIYLYIMRDISIHDMKTTISPTWLVKIENVHQIQFSPRVFQSFKVLLNTLVYIKVLVLIHYLML